MNSGDDDEDADYVAEKDYELVGTPTGTYGELHASSESAVPNDGADRSIRAEQEDSATRLVEQTAK